MVTVIILRRTNEAHGTVASAVLRSVKEREDIHSAKIPAKIAASWNVEGGIAGGQTRSAQKVGFKVCCICISCAVFHYFALKLASCIRFS